MHETIATLPTSHESKSDRALEALAVVCVGRDERGHRHIVHSYDGGVVAFLCGRWRPVTKVVRVDGGRRHAHVCLTCYKAWERRSKEGAH